MQNNSAQKIANVFLNEWRISWEITGTHNPHPHGRVMLDCVIMLAKENLWKRATGEQQMFFLVLLAVRGTVSQG